MSPPFLPIAHQRNRKPPARRPGARATRRRPRAGARDGSGASPRRRSSSSSSSPRSARSSSSIFMPSLLVNDSWMTLSSRTRDLRPRASASRRADGVRPRSYVDRPAVAGSARPLRDLLDRRPPAPRASRTPPCRRRVHPRRGRRALARGRAEGDLAALPARAPRRTVGLDDPRAAASAPALHRPPLAARDRGAAAVESRLDRVPDAPRVGEPARERRPRRAADDAPRRDRARSKPWTELAATSRCSSPPPLACSRPRTARSRRLATTGSCSSTRRSRHQVTEWMWKEPAANTVVFYVLAAIALPARDLGAPKRLSLFDVAVIAFTFIGAVNAIRGIPWFALACMLLLPVAIGRKLESKARRPCTRVQHGSRGRVGRRSSSRAAYSSPARRRGTSRAGSRRAGRQRCAAR